MCTAIYITEKLRLSLPLSNISCFQLGDTVFKIFIWGRYIGGYTVENLVLHRRVSRAVKPDFQLYIQ